MESVYKKCIYHGLNLAYGSAIVTDSLPKTLTSINVTKPDKFLQTVTNLIKYYCYFLL